MTLWGALSLKRRGSPSASALNVAPLGPPPQSRTLDRFLRRPLPTRIRIPKLDRNIQRDPSGPFLGGEDGLGGAEAPEGRAEGRIRERRSWRPTGADIR